MTRLRRSSLTTLGGNSPKRAHNQTQYPGEFVEPFPLRASLPPGGARLAGLLRLSLQHLHPLLAERRLGEPVVVHLLLLPAARWDRVQSARRGESA